jgi:hypothetical protein
LCLGSVSIGGSEGIGIVIARADRTARMGPGIEPKPITAFARR